MSSSIQPDESEIEKVHGKRSKFGEVESQCQPYNPFWDDEEEYDYSKEPGFVMPDLSVRILFLYPFLLDGSYNGGAYSVCDHRCDGHHAPRRDVDESLSLIPGMVIPPCLFDFAKEMIAKSDDKTVLATYLSDELEEDSHLLQLFKSKVDVKRAKLAIDQETGFSGNFGFVTFATKEDAQKAIEEFDGHVHGWDKRTMGVDWATPRTA
ncbi:eukaryotic translation initiation factor 3 subunit G-like [Trifolium medium]|uniref:Eukaryotic translation initiation factor 3 subunit G-like n=1 Tax=Trifolium medium TaxID=97028 RepID=A0A392M4R6_9FABA|nr:eukaryotic translation initiation factor 3 subunit G-like [Trifolium medium]